MEERRQCAYVLAIRSAIEFAKAGNTDLFTDSELETFAKIEALDEPASRVCSRLLFRRGLWIRPCSVRKYIQFDDAGACDDSVLVRAVRSLAEAGIVHLLSEHSDFSTAWSVVDALCKVEELLDIYRIVCGVKYKGKCARDEILATLYKSLTSQRTVLGTHLSSTFAKRLSTILSNLEGISLCPFCLDASVTTLIRRAQRLYQITSAMPSGSGVVSAHEVLEFCAPLMVTFKLVAYAPYSLCPRTATSSIFRSRRSFLQWEAAIELRALIDKLSAGPVPPSLAKRVLADVLPAFDNSSFSELFLDAAPPLGSWLEAQFFRDLEQHGEVHSAELFVTALVFLLSLHSSTDSSEVRSEDDYLLRIQAGSVLASLVVEWASTLEKGGQHRLAIAVYLFLLRLPYHTHRRGAWYIRLCIDCDHLALRGLSLTFAQAGLQDPLVQPADEVDLLHRCTHPPTRKALPDPLALELEAWVRRLDTASAQHRGVFLSAYLLREGTGWLLHTAGTAAAESLACAIAADKAVSPAPWACSVCTFANRVGKVCAMCSSERPHSVSTRTATVAAVVCVDTQTDVIDLCGEEDEEVAPLPPRPSLSSKLDDLLAQAQRLPLPLGEEKEAVPPPGVGGEGRGESASLPLPFLLLPCTALLHELGGDLPRPALQCFDVHGRRFGDPQHRRGKSRFCGQSGELMTVEALVQEKCWRLDVDSTALPPSRPASRPVGEEWQAVPYEVAVDGGGWRGWHDEGALLRSVCGMLLWDVFFGPPASPGPPVFVTPHQDGPLDASSARYFPRRQAAVEARVRAIGCMEAATLAAEIARLVRLHRGQRCAVVAWDAFSLAGMQVAALAVGAKALAVLCLALSRAARSLQSGGPDLFLVRARRRRGRVSPPSDASPAPPPASASDDSILDLDIWLGGTQWRLPPPGTQRGAPGLSPDLDSLSSPAPALPSPSPSPSPGAEGGHDEDASPAKKARGAGDDALGEAVLCALQAGELCLEGLLVEVKGPSDVLANKQVVWLQLAGLLAPTVRAYVCQVKES